jgi:hypothetical protein
MLMAEREQSAAQALYSHLKSGTPEPVQQRQGGSIAEAVYAHLKPPQADTWQERYFQMVGLRKIRGK